MITIDNKKVYYMDRYIGFVEMIEVDDESLKVFSTKRELGKHLYKNLNSFNVNKDVLNTFEYIQIYCEDKRYVISVKKIRRLEKYYNIIVKHQNYEPQVAIPLVIMSQIQVDRIGKHGVPIRKFISIVGDGRNYYHAWNRRSRCYK